MCIRDRFKDQGIILSKDELFIMESSYKNSKELKNRIDDVYTNKKVAQFSAYPVVTDLIVNPEIAQDIIDELKKPGNDMKEILLKENPGMTIESIINYIEAIIRHNKKSIWNNGWLICFVAALVVLAISFIIYRVSQGSAPQLSTGNSTVSENFTNPVNATVNNTVEDLLANDTTT
eukprot:TRINITY_DN6827_c0_g1_i2.p1 TRINITY_DN6827_c0_g1~~TRINITY_DN6827_c0_g1_i2.p1  ORF type:complete len:176 (-),score=51.87 TRINITY_DN6827_c0_g1_i2:155-682(-)